MIIDRHTGVRVARYQTHEGVRRGLIGKIHSSNQVHLANQTFYSVSSPGAPPGLNGVSPSDFPEHFFLSFFLAQQRNNGCFTHWNSFRCDSLWQSTPDGKINLWSKSKLQRHCQHAHIQQSAWTHPSSCPQLAWPCSSSWSRSAWTPPSSSSSRLPHPSCTGCAVNPHDSEQVQIFYSISVFCLFHIFHISYNLIIWLFRQLQLGRMVLWDSGGQRRDSALRDKKETPHSESWNRLILKVVELKVIFVLLFTLLGDLLASTKNKSSEWKIISGMMI